MDWHAIEAGTHRPVTAAEILGRRIVSGDLTPGTTLPNLDQLAEQFSISRLSMREPIKVLAGKGLVSSTPRRGTVVRPRTEWSRLDPDVMVWQIGDSKRRVRPHPFRVSAHGRARGGRLSRGAGEQ